MVCRLTRIARVFLVFGGAITLGLSCNAQATSSGTEIPDSRVDIYGGYGYFHPINSGIHGYQYTELNDPNATVSVTGFFDRYVGVQIEASYFTGARTPASAAACTTACAGGLRYYTAQGGPVFRLPLGRWIPYVHALGGGARYNGPVQQQLRWGWGVTGGVGLDYVMPFAHNIFAVRPIQADFQYSQVVYGPLELPAGVTGGFGEIDALKLSGGIVMRLNEVAEKHSPMLGCTSEPPVVYPGDAVQIHGSTLYLNPHKKPFYTWTSSGGRIMPNDSEATVETGGLAPGEYVVTGRLREGMTGKERANCTAPFVVKPFDPPTVSCTATPPAVITGAVVDISTVGTSPQNRPLSYSYSSSAGQITSNGKTAQLSTEGVAAQTVSITCNVVDDQGKTAKATTLVAVNNPPPPPPAAAAAAEHSRPLCSLAFTRDRGRPVRVDNEAKGCLDDVALTMNQQSSASLVIVGNRSAEEKSDAGAQRALNIRQYLTREKGIDSARIQLRTGDTSGRTARTALVPQGAAFDESNTAKFDESSVRRRGQAYGTQRAPGGRPTSRAARNSAKASSQKALNGDRKTPQPAPAGATPPIPSPPAKQAAPPQQKKPATPKTKPATQTQPPAQAQGASK